MKFLLMLAIIAITVDYLTGARLQCRKFTDQDGDQEFDKVASNSDSVWKNLERRGFSKKRKQDRKSLFRGAIRKINEHNRGGNITFCRGLNQFSAMSADEKSRYLGAGIIARLQQENVTLDKDNGPVSGRRKRDVLPQSVDIRSWTGPVESQGPCGACWAFSASHALTGAMYAKYKTVTQYSEQMLLDCIYFWDGCYGGWSNDVWNYVQTHGLSSDQEYPYTGWKGNCKSKSGQLPNSWNFVSLFTGDEALMAARVAQGPLTVAFHVLDDFFSYKQGVYDTTQLCGFLGYANHEFLVVGYGTDPVGGDYWLVKNSWGPLWGENGYGRVKRGKNLCAIATWAKYIVMN